MTMTRSRKASKSAAPAEMVAKSAGVADLDRFFEDADRDFRRKFANIKSIFRSGDADPAISYTQAQHSAVLAQLSHFEGMVRLLTNSLAEAHGKIDRQERELKAAKSLHTKAFDGLQVEQIDDRRVRLALGSGEDEASFEIAFPMLIDRGAWSERAAYDRGDAVTAAGGFWVAQVDNPPARPGVGDSGWRLVVKSPRGAEQRK